MRRRWIDPKQQERQRILRSLLTELRIARENRAPWYVWIIDGKPPLTREEYQALKQPGGRAARRAAKRP